MRTKNLSRFATLVATFGLVFCSFQASPEDIDIFSVDEDNNINNPNVLFVIDNSANWSRQAQQWPGGEDQGQSEVDAIKTVINELDAGINVGLMEFVTGGSSADTDFGFIRYHIRPMTTANKAAFSAQLTAIYDNINDPAEKRGSGMPYGNLFWDVYNYLAGEKQANAGAGTPSSADAGAYDTAYDDFASPLTTLDTCTRTIVIFIGNNVSSGPTPDSADNLAALKALAGGGDPGDTAVAQIPFADYLVSTSTRTADLGYTSVCYADAAACTTASNTAACSTDQGFLSCSCDAADFVACPSAHWNIVGSKITTSSTVISGPTTTVTNNASTGDIVQTCKNATQGASLNPTACPNSSDITLANTPQAGQSTQTQTSWSGCSYVSTGVGTCSGGKENYDKQGTKTEIVTVTGTSTSTVTTGLGESTACYNDAPTCTAGEAGSCSGYDSCACTSEGSGTGCAAGNTERYQVQGTFNVTQATQTGTFSAAPAGPYMMDEWARFLRQTGVPVPGVPGVRSQVTTYTLDAFNAQQDATQSALLFNAARVGGGKYFQTKDKNAILNALRQILTEVQAVNSAFSSASLPVNATNRAQNANQVFIGVFKPDRVKDPLWFGNLKRYKLISSGASIDLGDANDKPAINNQTGFITDCAVSEWSTDSGPFWNNAITDDPDAIGICPSNSTSDYSDLPDGPFVEKGAVAEVLRKGNGDPTQDSDRNYFVNRQMYTVSSGALVAFDETSSGLDAETVNFIRGEDVDAFDANGNGTLSPVVTNKTRSTIHGDVVHSRPQPVNHGDTADDVVVYYGSNDGVFHSVQAKTGQELWSFVAPEHFSVLSRLRKNVPPILYFADDPAGGGEPKDYFFDGSTGVFQNEDNSVIWIFPTMRRGGRKVYAFDVTKPSAPDYKWSKGCPNLKDDTDCDTGFEAIGQTWAIPNVAFIKGYCGSTPCADASTPRKPVVVLAGGYDRCDDDNNWTPGCGAPKGTGVYVIDADDGTLVRYFDFSKLSGFGARSVPADVALIDIDSDSMVDYGYAVDTGGSVYRFDFIDGPTSKVAVDDPTKWAYSRVAYTDKGGRKFLFPPALVQITATKIYLAVGTGDREHPLKSNYPYEDRDDDGVVEDDDLDGVTDAGVLNRFYVVKDNLADIDETTAVDLDGSTMADYTTDTDCSSAPILPGSTQDGWFMELGAAGRGEQVVTSAVVAAGFVFFSTNRPTDAVTTACSTSLGEARGYFVNLLNASGAIGVAGACGGTRSSVFVGGGLPPSPVLATVEVGGELRTVVIGAVQKTGEPSSPIQSQRVRPPIASDRKPIYWYKSTGDK